jgi:hypothetical protein
MVGEHIRALRGGRWVHAIDCGDETVLHLAEDAAPRRVRRAYRPEFVAGAQSVELVTHRERTFPAEEVVRRAYSRAADPTLATMFGDSQAFAEWCTTGRISGPANLAVAVPAASGPAATPSPRQTGKGEGATSRARRPKRKPAAAKASAARPKAARAKARTAPKRKVRAAGGSRTARERVRSARPSARAKATASRKRRARR